MLTVGKILTQVQFHSNSQNISSAGSFFTPDGARFLFYCSFRKTKIKRDGNVVFVLHVSPSMPVATGYYCCEISREWIGVCSFHSVFIFISTAQMSSTLNHQSTDADFDDLEVSQ
jgi:hypothetical protein